MASEFLLAIEGYELIKTEFCRSLGALLAGVCVYVYMYMCVCVMCLFKRQKLDSVKILRLT